MDNPYQLPSPSPYEPLSSGPSHSFIERVLGAFRLERPIFDEVRRDPSAMMQAAGLIALTGFASGLGNYYGESTQSFTVDDRTYEVGHSFLGAIASGLITIILALIAWVIISLIYRFVATRMLGAVAIGMQWQEVARPIGFASAPSLLALLTPIPLLGGIAALIGTIWAFAAQIVALSETFHFSKWRAFATILVSAILAGLVLSLIGCICVVAFLAIA